MDENEHVVGLAEKFRNAYDKLEKEGPANWKLFRWLPKRSTLDIQDLNYVNSALLLRTTALELTAARLRHTHFELSNGQAFALASTDLFVEKAQRLLTRRSDMLFLSGFIAIIFTLVLLGGAIDVVYDALKRPVDQQMLGYSQYFWQIPIVSGGNGYVFFVRLVQTLSLSGFVLVGVKYLIALARAFFHEALSLRERRHALRFGRLYIYLCARLGVDQANKGIGFRLEELETAFQWNKQTPTAFLDMDPSVTASTLFNSIADAFGKAPAEVAKAISDLAAAHKS